MDENTGLLTGRKKETVPGPSQIEGPGIKVKVAQGAVLVTITLERLAFYSLAGNLVLFLNKNPFQWKSYNSVSALFFFFGISYFTSFIGGLIADTLLGRFKTLFLSLLVYLVGYIFLPLIGSEHEEKLPHICHSHGNDYLRNISDKQYTIEHNESAFHEDCAGLIFGVLMLIAVGSGAFRSNIAPFGADQVHRVGQQTNLTFFNWYYWCINVGSLIALSVITYIQQHEMGGFYWGYLSALICLAVGAVVFLCGTCSYVYRPKSGSPIKNIFKVVFEACSKCRGSHCCCKRNVSVNRSDNAIEEPTNCLDYAKYRYGGSFQETTVNEVKKMIKIFFVFLTLIPYWMVYFQMETTFLIQGLHMNLNLPGEKDQKSFNCSPQNISSDDFDTGGKQVKLVAAWFSLFDVIFVIILIPLFDRIIYPRLAKRGRPMGFVLRVSLGMLFAAMAVCVAGVVEHYRLKSIYRNETEPCCRYRVEQKIGNTKFYAAEMSIFWQIPQYALIGLSEVFASIAALEFAYQMAPRSAKGIIMGLFYLFSGVGSFLGVASITILQGIWFGPYDSGNINCRTPCTSNKDGSFNISLRCHLDYYFFFLAVVECFGLILFLVIVKLCNIQREISTVTLPKSPSHSDNNPSSSSGLNSPISVQRQNSDLSVT